MACAADEHPHALVVPASGQGHVNASMLLAKSLASLGFRVSFVYFSSEYAKLQAKQRLHPEPHLAPTECDADPSFLHSTALNHHTGPGSSTARGSPYHQCAPPPHPAPPNATTMTPTSPLNNGETDHRGFIHIHVVDDGVAHSDIDKLQLFFVTPAMKENLFNLILELQEHGTPPTCLIADTVAPWTLHVAERASLPLVSFWTSNAMAYLLVHSLSLLFSQEIFPEKGPRAQWKRETPLMLSHIPGVAPFSSELYPKDVRFADASDPFVSLLNEVASCGQHGERMLIHTMAEIEPDAFRALQAVGIPAYAVGSLLHDTKKQEGSSASSQAMENLGEPDVLQLNEKHACIEWLDRQAELSVIYVAFGSQASISVVDIQELAYGLEASRKPFLWVIRGDSHGGAELPQVLLNGLLDRIRGKGMIISWAPQVEVLAHKAVGGFLTHCGWNSTLESLWEGVPMLCCPCFAEQSLNSHYLCDVWGVGLELARTETGGIERGYVEAGVKGLMQEQEGLRARRKAQEVMQLARKTCQPGGQSFSNLRKFYEDMKELCFKPSLESAQ